MAHSSGKIITVQLLKLLYTETDQDHRLYLEELAQRLEEVMGVTHSRKTLRGDLDAFQQAGLPVVYNRGWYYQHCMEPSELDYAMNCVAGSVGLPRQEKFRLLQKMRCIGGHHYKPPVLSVSRQPGNGELLSNMAQLRQAIEAKEQVEILYGYYGEDKGLHIRYTRTGNPRRYLLNPYGIVPHNGRLYLLALVNRHEKIGHFRMDRVIAVRLLHKPAKPMPPEDEEIYLSGDYAAHHPYMYTGEMHTYRVVLHKDAINNVLDFFGTDAEFVRVSERRLEAVVRSDAQSMKHWMRRFEDKIGAVTMEGVRI